MHCPLIPGGCALGSGWVGGRFDWLLGTGRLGALRPCQLSEVFEAALRQGLVGPAMALYRDQGKRLDLFWHTELAGEQKTFLLLLAVRHSVGLVHWLCSVESLCPSREEALGVRQLSDGPSV